ncbi:PadR family transcriptional regulator [Colwellia hornerae]|uniref:PadR family transcriptional regulator n=1 Tax=Colwellia hornerae TaxID=89402 RepID=A0A5C6QAN5_9GAMM|nr:helix-turn-helix transcriptional regulator [Colwellia hornerae]TWX51127.1 PadR family transcriptional regulator [Colwellia hornerae]TWX56803.1 PadR family transcriptional regulator [Colwellia hornerae]TWX66046.1 PadR family transcriptional regulator [Colwellia hornerae]
MANKKSYLGEFEHLVLLSVMHLGEDAYGVTVRRHLKNTIDRDVSIGALYSTVERLEKKGLITSKKGEAKAERGGKAKRYFKLTSDGITNLKYTKDKLELMWEKLPDFFSMGAC